VGRVVRILDFDIENRPSSYIGADFTSAEVTAVAACWADEPKSMRVWLVRPGVLGTRPSLVALLKGFRPMYDAADMVTCHFGRVHDLPKINGAMIEFGLPLISDTKLDFMRHGQHMSGGQEGLCGMLGLPEAKVHLSHDDWRRANRFEPAALKKIEARVVGDVVQHMALRRKLVERGLLGPPKVWRP